MNDVHKEGNVKRHPIVQEWLDGGNDAGGCVASLERALFATERALSDYRRLEQMLEDESDVRDGPEGKQLPNAAMSILTRWREAT